MPVTAAAVTDDFTVELSYFTPDSIPPSTPVLASSTPISDTQISLIWSTSTDDQVLAGYQVFRDGSFVATTTLPMYVDAGLLASTTYSHTVRAFDTAFNYSTTSNSVSTTTLQTPVSPTANSNDSQTTRVAIEVYNFDTTIKETEASFSWNTNRPTRFIFRYGLTTDYELGSRFFDLSQIQHSYLLDGLVAGTQYYYEIIAMTAGGRDAVVSRSTFVTDDSSFSDLPPNVTQFTATVEGIDVALAWQVPTFDDFAYVRIVANNTFYPRDPADGVTVYQGANTSYQDTNVLSVDTYRYYTIFVYSSSGTISSGVVAGAGTRTKAQSTNSPRLPDRAREEVEEKEEVVKPFVPYTVSITDLQYKQPGSQLRSFGSVSNVDGSRNILFSLPYTAVPEHLKSIMVTLVDTNDATQQFSFLLRINEDKTAYEALLAPLGVSGAYEVVLAVHDYAVGATTTDNGMLYSQIVGTVAPDAQWYVWYGLFAVWLIILMVIMRWLFFSSEE